MKIRTLLSRLTKRTKVLAGITAAAAILSVPAVVYAGFGPNGGNRTIYDFSNPAQREGAFDGPRFNSYINTNVYGDERAFVDAKECVVNGAECYQQGVAGGYKDQQPVEAGKEYIIRAYVHNIANPSINDNTSTPEPMDGIGVAKNTRIRFELPDTEGVANGFTAQARITADNAIPQQVYDTVDLLNNDKKFNVSYIPGSAYIFNASHTNGLKLSDDIMGQNGTLIGDEEMNGVYPGCFEYSAFVVIRVKVTAPEVEIEKLVSKVEMPKMSDTAETVTVKRGETVHWRLNYKNTGTLFADDVTVRDTLPKGLEIVPGSVKLTTALGTETIPDTALGSGGANVGDYTPEGNGVIRFSTKVNTDPEVCELTNIAFVRASNTPKEDSDTAKVIISDCNPDTEEPIYACVDLKMTLIGGSNNSYTLKTESRAQNGATVKHYSYDFGDGTAVLVTDKDSVTHTYAKAGTYMASVDVTFNVGDNQTATDENNPDCVAKVSYEVKGTTTLPETGAGGMIGLFAGITAAGAALHRRMTLRRN